MFLKSLYLVLFCLALTANSKNQLSITAKDVNQALNQTRNATWRAEENNIFDQFADKTGPIFGLIEKDISFYRNNLKKYTPRRRVPLAPSLDWRNAVGQNWITPVTNQGQCGSCVAFASIAAIEAKYNIEALSPYYNLNLSEQHLWTCSSKSCNSGWYLFGGFSAMQSSGTPDESCFPYISGNMGADFSCSQTCTNSESRKYKIKDYTSIGTYWGNASLDEIKQALIEGPVIASMTVYEDFMYYKSGVYKHTTGNRLGGHAITIIGYNDSDNAFIVKNSWGADWGENGFFRISYSDNSSNITQQVIVPHIEKPKGFISFINPSSFGMFVENQITLQAINTYTFPVEMTAYLANHGETQPLGSIPLDTLDNSNFATTFDTSTLENGVYDLWLEGRSNSVSNIKSAYTTIFVINEEPQISLVLTKLNTKEKDAVYFSLECKDYSVPLKNIEMLLTGPNLYKVITLDSPCPKMEFGYNAKNFESGKFNLVGTGFIGTTYTFKTNIVEFDN